MRAKQCIESLVASRGATAVLVLFEKNGKFARVVLEYPDEAKAAVLFDLEADQVLDLVPADELDELIAEFDAAGSSGQARSAGERGRVDDRRLAALQLTVPRLPRRGAHG